jgi:glycerol-3-phosphate dehydrogenase
MPADALQYDIVIIGAGINGAAIAREAALLGFKVHVVERDDVASGTSAASTRLIHGGLRYLEYAEFGLVYESLAERERLLRFAPHLVEPLPFYVPIFAHGKRRPWQIRTGMWLYDLLSITKSVPHHSMLSRAEFAAAVPGVRNEGLLGGARYYDAQLAFPERLIVELLSDALAQGAKLSTYTSVTEIITVEGAVRGVRVRNARGERSELLAKCVVNASGPWADKVTGKLAHDRLVGGTRGSHLIVRPFDGAPAGAVYAEAAADGRPFFIVPWNGLYLIGTTDVRDDSDPALAAISADERAYLLAETRRLMPLAGDLSTRICYAYSGMRPLPYVPGGREGAITRRHIVHAHSDVPGLYSIIGGKLTTHRALAVDVMAKLRERLPWRCKSSPTAARPLPGAVGGADRRELEAALAAAFGQSQANRLIRIYGKAAADVLASVRDTQELGMVIAPGSRVLVAELQRAFSTEWAKNLTDVMQRRCMAGLDADFGLDGIDAAATWLVRLGFEDRASAHAQAAHYRNWARRFVRPRAIAVRPDAA